MGKKAKRDKEVARLRREVEILKAQLAGQKIKMEKGAKAVKAEEGASSVAAPATPVPLPISYLKGDLLKTFSLTLISLAIIFALFLTQPQWPEIADSLRLTANKLKLPF